MLDDYSTNISNKKQFHIWICDLEGCIFLKKTFQQIPILKVSDVTFVSENESNLIDEIDFVWTEQIKIVGFKEIYTIIEDNTLLTGYLLELDLDLDQKEYISHKLAGKFIDYHEIDEKIQYHKRDLQLIESYISVIETMDARFGLSNQNTNFFAR